MSDKIFRFTFNSCKGPCSFDLESKESLKEFLDKSSLFWELARYDIKSSILGKDSFRVRFTRGFQDRFMLYLNLDSFAIEGTTGSAIKEEFGVYQYQAMVGAVCEVAPMAPNEIKSQYLRCCEGNGIFFYYQVNLKLEELDSADQDNGELTMVLKLKP